MKNDKSQGSDGYTAEFNNFVWKDICHLDTKKPWRPKSLLNVPYTLYNSIYCKQTKTSTII